MNATDDTARDGGWGAVLAGVEGANPGAGAAAPGRDGWGVIDALVDRSSGGAANADDYARIVAQVGAFVPSDLRGATETLLRVAAGTSSWAGAVIDAPSSPPVVASAPDGAGAPVVPSMPVAQSMPDSPTTRVAPTTPHAAGPEPAREPAPAPAPERAPVSDTAPPDDPTFEAAIAATPPAERRPR